MSLDRRLPAKAHMGALVVIKVDNSLQESHTVSSGCNLHFVQPFTLDDSVCAFCYCILQRVSAFGHADAYAPSFKFRDISVATVLSAPVGVVDEPAGSLQVNRGEGHLQCLQWVYSLQCRAEGPPHYLAGVRIRNQRQITDTLVRLHIGNI